MDYIQVQRQGKSATATSPVSVARIMAVYGGLARKKDTPFYALELTTATRKLQLVNCHGDVAGVRAVFAQLAAGYEDRFLAIEAVRNPLPNLRREAVQPTLVRVGRIEQIEPNVPRRKAKSIIIRTGLPPILATETPALLAERLLAQGYQGSIEEASKAFVLAAQHRDAVPAIPPIQRRVKTLDPFSPQEQFEF
jgi:hypothetical protein